jgi:DNA-binding response OmpR family regulator
MVIAKVLFVSNLRFAFNCFGTGFARPMIVLFNKYYIKMQRILAVDDNEDILEIMKLILEDYGYEVATLADGMMIFDAIDANHPDLILLDVMLGNADGRELCRQLKLKQETHDIPVILVSASHQVADRLSLNNGAPDDFLAKPFDINDLLEKVGSNLAAA